MKNILQTSMAALALGMALPGFAAGSTEGVTVNHLGPTNTLVRVNGDAARYIMLPVQESIDDARVNVIVDGRLDQTIYVRLAKSKVDYSVPFDLSQYKGKDVVFDIVSRQGRESVREAVTDACWDNITLTDTIDLSNKEKYRPIYHHTPPYGWMNDPNGMFYKDGEWQLYYQWNPYGSRWQNMTWGHSSSKDLIHWEHHPAAIRPNGLGTVFSGSSAIDKTGSAGFGKDAVLAMYTSCGASQMQSIAVSHDNGETFDVYPGNPVLTLETEARDPNMFWNDKEQKWNMVLAHALEKEILIFSSPDMKEWTLESAFGKGLGAQDGVWECPDLFRLTVPGTDISKWVMIVNLNPGGPFGGSGIQYFIGDFDGHTFTVDTDAQGNVPTKWLDFGKDNYALVSWSDAPDNRRVAIGWMSNWQYADQVPTLQYRSANTLPREIGIFQGSDGQIYASSTPSPELEAMRLKPTVRDKSFSVGKNYKNFTLPAANDGICEIVLTLESKEADLTMALSNAAGEKVVMNYQPSTSTFAFDRTQSGVTDFSVDFPAITAAPTFESDGSVTLRLFIDRSSIEVFEKDGKFSMTNLVFPTKPYTTLSFRSAGNARVAGLTIYPLKP